MISPSIQINVEDPETIDEQQKEDTTCYDTIDALPHADHYRNLFSITSPESKARPTLEALHETAPTRVGSTIDLNSDLTAALVPSNEICSNIEKKNQIQVVKFGWIVGVLVRFDFNFDKGIKIYVTFFFC